MQSRLHGTCLRKKKEGGHIASCKFSRGISFNSEEEARRAANDGTAKSKSSSLRLPPSASALLRNYFP